LVDVAGSMSGRPTEQVKQTMQEFFKLSKPDDTFQVVTFAGSANELFEKYVPATKANIERALNFTRGIRGGGGTRMLQGIKKVVDAPVDPRRMRIVIMLTDGFIGNEKEIINEVDQKCGDNIRFWTVGIGNSVNRFLIDGVARQGGGMGKVLSLDESPAKLVPEIVERIHRAQLAKINIDWAGLGVHEIYPMKIPELWAGRPVILFGRYFQPGEATIMINGLIEGEPISYPVTVALPDAQPEHGVLAQVWARKKIEDLTYQMMGSEVQELVDEVTSTALNYRLMSKYTSFVAVDEKDVGTIRGPATPPRRVTVPVPMPDGVSWEGVFGPGERQLLADKDMIIEELELPDGVGVTGHFHGVYGTRGGSARRKALLRFGGSATEKEAESRLGVMNGPAAMPTPMFAAGASIGKASELRLGNGTARGVAIARRPTVTANFSDAYTWGWGGGRPTSGIVDIAKAAAAESGKDKITFETNQASVKEALEWLSKETGVKITIADEAKDAADKIKVPLRTNREMTLAQALDWIQQRTGFGFTYKGGAIQLVRSNWQLADERRQEAQKAETDGKLAAACALYKQAYILAGFSRDYRAQSTAQMALSGLLRARQTLLDQYVENLPDLKKQLDLVIRHQSLQDAIAAVQKAGGVKISVREGSFDDVMALLELDRLHVVYLDLRNATVAQALDWLLDPFQLDWQADGKSVVVGTSRRLTADAPAPWVYSIGYIATPIKEELGEDKAANRKLLVEAPQKILDAVRSVVKAGEVRLLDRSRLMAFGTSGEHTAVANRLRGLRTAWTDLQLPPPPPRLRRYTARAELRARRIAQKQQQAVLGALDDYSWKLMAGALAGEADLEALTWLQFAWNHEECANALKTNAQLSARALWCASAATRLLQKNADVRALAQKAVAAAAPNAPDGTAATLEYALAARNLAAAGIKHDKLGDEFVAAAAEA
ncbi:MAG: VWA domain-containing protein, partial [Planctomycetes bacterium]|nr:VWA domain-containing protein [Planctomycetota bacterium]